MKWIKQNSFLSGLVAITVAGALLLWLLGTKSSGRYEKAKADYEQALADTLRYETLDLYPKPEHLENKKIAIQSYRDEAEELQKAFGRFRPESLENISIQAFSTAVKAANSETRLAFGEDIQIPEEYFCGFEVYRAGSPPGDATGILNYQLGALKQLMLRLAEVKASGLINIHRPLLPEEKREAFAPEKGQVARKLPLEIVFTGTEDSVRDFLSSVVNDKEYFMVVRSWRIVNKKKIPPRKTDATFDDRAPRNDRVGGAADNQPNFGDLFNNDENVEGDAEFEALPEQPDALALPPGGSGRILSQVLGQEELEVFVRLDLLLFLEAQELP